MERRSQELYVMGFPAVSCRLYIEAGCSWTRDQRNVVCLTRELIGESVASLLVRA